MGMKPSQFEYCVLGDKLEALGCTLYILAFEVDRKNLAVTIRRLIDSIENTKQSERDRYYAYREAIGTVLDAGDWPRRIYDEYNDLYIE